MRTFSGKGTRHRYASKDGFGGVDTFYDWNTHIFFVDSE